MNVEYKILTASALINEQQLNELAGRGWRLIAIVPAEGQYYFYFERLAVE